MTIKNNRFLQGNLGESAFNDEGDQNDFEESFSECPKCGGEGTPMGPLGHRMQYRCRQCGSEWSKAMSQGPGSPAVGGQVGAYESNNRFLKELNFNLNIGRPQPQHPVRKAVVGGTLAAGAAAGTYAAMKHPAAVKKAVSTVGQIGRKAVLGANNLIAKGVKKYAGESYMDGEPSTFDDPWTQFENWIHSQPEERVRDQKGILQAARAKGFHEEASAFEKVDPEEWQDLVDKYHRKGEFANWPLEEAVNEKGYLKPGAAGAGLGAASGAAYGLHKGFSPRKLGAAALGGAVGGAVAGLGAHAAMKAAKYHAAIKGAHAAAGLLQHGADALRAGKEFRGDGEHHKRRYGVEGTWTPSSNTSLRGNVEFESVKDIGRKAAAGAIKFVRRHPVASTVGAAAVGAKLGSEWQKAKHKVAQQNNMPNYESVKKENFTTSSIGTVTPVQTQSGKVSVQKDPDETYCIVITYEDGNTTYLETGIASEEEANTLLADYQKMYGGGEEYKSESTMRPKISVKALIETVARNKELREQDLYLFLEDEDLGVALPTPDDKSAGQIDPNAEPDKDEQDVKAHATPDGMGKSGDAPQGTLPEQDGVENGSLASQVMAAGNPEDDQFMESVQKQWRKSIRERMAKAIGIKEEDLAVSEGDEPSIANNPLKANPAYEAEQPPWLKKDGEDKKDDDKGEEKEEDDEKEEGPEEEEEESEGEEKGEEKKESTDVFGLRHSLMMRDSQMGPAKASYEPRRMESISSQFRRSFRSFMEAEGIDPTTEPDDSAEMVGATPDEQVTPSNAPENANNANPPVKESHRRSLTVGRFSQSK